MFFFHILRPQFVEGYTAKILDLITSGLGPDQLCLALNICSETKEVAPVEEEEAVGDQCVLCEYVVSTLDKMVTDKANEAEIQVRKSSCMRTLSQKNRRPLLMPCAPTYQSPSVHSAPRSWTPTLR